jgi:hypothetical protein
MHVRPFLRFERARLFNNMPLLDKSSCPNVVPYRKFHHLYRAGGHSQHVSVGASFGGAGCLGIEEVPVFLVSVLVSVDLCIPFAKVRTDAEKVSNINTVNIFVVRCLASSCVALRDPAGMA